MAADHKSQEAKLGDIEDRLRRNNLQFLGFPEGSEGKCPKEFLLTWLKWTFGEESFSHLFAIESAHWVPLRAPPLGRFPRPLLARFLNFRDKETILQSAWNMPDLLYNKNHITIFLYFSAATQKQQAAFQSVKLRPPRTQSTIQYAIPCEAQSSAQMQDLILYLTQGGQSLAGVAGENLMPNRSLHFFKCICPLILLPFLGPESYKCWRI